MTAPAVGAVGWPEIDALHVEFEQCLDELRAASDAMLARALATLREHLLRHFGAEEQWMAECNFPVAACHKREHDGVLDVLTEVQRRCAQGDHDIARRLTAELPLWFEQHAHMMDGALADYLNAQKRATVGVR
jgi:hemerythrin-like metal-binding protein